MKLKLAIKKGEGLGGYFSENSPVPLETPEALYREVLDRLNARGVEDPTWLDSLDCNNPAYNEAKDKLNRVWLESLGGRASLEDFKEALSHYEEVLMGDAIQRPKTLETGRLF